MSQFTKRELKFAILACLADGKKHHKVNVIGRAYPGGGDLSRRLGIELDDETRALAGVAFDELVVSDLIRPDYSDLSDPEKWGRITERGKKALDRNAIDELDEVLLEIDPQLVSLRDGAWSALNSPAPDSTRQIIPRGVGLY